MSYFYVISPVGSDPDFEAKKAILVGEGETHQCEAFLPLDRRKEFSMKECRADLAGAAFVLADLSRERPSCYFELGLAYAVGLPVVIIADHGTIIHQVADRSAVLSYSDLTTYGAIVARVLAEYAC